MTTLSLIIKADAARKKPYGHTSYYRKTKTGKVVHVQAKGARPIDENFQSAGPGTRVILEREGGGRGLEWVKDAHGVWQPIYGTHVLETSDLALLIKQRASSPGFRTRIILRDKEEKKEESEHGAQIKIRPTWAMLANFPVGSVVTVDITSRSLGAFVYHKTDSTKWSRGSIHGLHTDTVLDNLQTFFDQERSPRIWVREAEPPVFRLTPPVLEQKRETREGFKETIQVRKRADLRSRAVKQALVGSLAETYNADGTLRDSYEKQVGDEWRRQDGTRLLDNAEIHDVIISVVSLHGGSAKLHLMAFEPEDDYSWLLEEPEEEPEEPEEEPEEPEKESDEELEARGLEEFFGGEVDVATLLGVYSAPESGLTATRNPQSHRSINADSDSVELKFVLRDSQGRLVGRIERTFKHGEHGLQVNHDYFKVDDAFQGKGIAAEIMERSIAFYKKIGVSTITVHANIDVGGYTWAKFGFDFTHDSNRNATRRRFVAKLEALIEGDEHMMPSMLEKLIKKINNFEYPWQFAALVINGKHVGKKWMLGSDWYGYLDIDDHKHKGNRVCRAYINKQLRKKGGKVKKAEDGDDRREDEDQAFLEVAKKLGFLTSVSEKAPKLVVKADPYGHSAYTRIVHGKAQFIAPKGVKPQDNLEAQAFAQRLQRKIGRLGKGKGRTVKLTQEELKVVLDSGKFALVSGGKSPHDKDGFNNYDAKKRHKILKANLISKGYAFTQVVDNYGGVEDSFLVMVHDADLDDMMAMGRSLKQDSIIYGTEGKYTAYFTTGDNVGKCVRASSWKLKPEATNYYTEYSHPDGEVTKFALDLDFDEVVSCDEKAASFTMHDLAKSIPHAAFVTTAMTMLGKVKKLNEGRFGAKRVMFDNGVKAVLKSKPFSNANFRGVKVDTQHLHEAAAYQLDRQILGFGVVPPTVLTMYKEVPTSLQVWVTGLPAGKLVPGVFDRRLDGWKSKVVQLATKVNLNGARKIVLLDLITNNTDRHAKNCIFDTFSSRAWAIDNGLCFGRYYHKYNNVLHRYIFRNRLRLKPDERERLEGVTVDQLTGVLNRYLTKREIEETYWRIRWVLSQPSLGFEAIAPGVEGKDGFPSFEGWFRDKMRSDPRNKVLARLAAMGSQPTISSAFA